MSWAWIYGFCWFERLSLTISCIWFSRPFLANRLWSYDDIGHVFFFIYLKSHLLFVSFSKKNKKIETTKPADSSSMVISKSPGPGRFFFWSASIWVNRCLQAGNSLGSSGLGRLVGARGQYSGWDDWRKWHNCVEDFISEYHMVIS